MVKVLAKNLSSAPKDFFFLTRKSQNNLGKGKGGSLLKIIKTIRLICLKKCTMAFV